MRALLLLPLLTSCGVAVQPLEAFDVVLAPVRDCTLTGAATRDCVDDSLLAQRRTRGRWVFEHAADSSFTLTTEQGTTLAGIHFNDDARVLNEAPCIGEGGLCYFARRRFESSDADGCTAFGELVAILRRADDSTVTGLVADVSGTDQDCGTSTVVERQELVNGTRVDEPAQAREVAP
jgi:hypothetical protein